MLLCRNKFFEQPPLVRQVGALGQIRAFDERLLGGVDSGFCSLSVTDPVCVRMAALRHKQPIRNGRLGENKGQDGFDAMAFGSF